MLSVFTREWLDVDIAICDGVDRRAGRVRGRGDPRRRRRVRRSRVHRRAPASRNVKAASVRVRTTGASARHDGRRRGPARDRERPRHRRRPLARRRLRGPAARHLLHRVVLRAGFRLRVAAAAVHTRRPREPAAPQARDRPGRDDELSRRHLRSAERAGEAGGRGRRPRRRTCAERARARAPGVRGGRDRLGSRGVHGRGGAGAPAGRDVAPDPRGVCCAQSAGARSTRRRVRPVANGVLHRRP